MKKGFRILAAVLVLCSLLSLPAYAVTPTADIGSGLGVFEDVAQMTSYTFSDLETGHWAYYGIKVSYDKGILLGYQDGTYRPENEVTWGQAIVIAARIHAAYYGNALNVQERPGDYWYDPYYRYCAAMDMIPSSCPKGVNLDRVAIPRYALAYIFSRTVDAEDMPTISDRQITDLDTIPAEYLDSVKLMYSSGVMNGWKDYSFGGNRVTTRAQIAMVIARLLQPADRVGHDSKINSDMAAFEANLENDSPAVQVGSSYYCVYKYYEDTSTQLYALYRTDGNNNLSRIYTCKSGERLDNLSLYKGKVYFCVSTMGTADGKLMCLDPQSGKMTTVYTGNAVEAYCFYDGGIYALMFTGYAEQVADYKFTFGTISGGEFIGVRDFDYKDVMYFQPYGWNGCIYFKLTSEITLKKPDGTDGDTTLAANLWCYDIARGEFIKLSDININTSFFDGHVMYFMAYDAEGNYDLNLYAMSVQAPAVVKTVGTFPAQTGVRYRSIYKFEDTFYCLSSFNRNLYSMDKSGSSRLALMCGGVYDSLCFTDDKAILIPNTLATSNVNEIKVYNAKSLSSRALYGDWMGESCYYKGARFVPDDGQPYYTSGDESVSTISDISITVPQAFERDGDFIVRAKVVNNMAATIDFRMYVVKVYCGNELVAYDVNKMVSMEMKQHDIQTFTFVIGKQDVLGSIDMTRNDITIEIVPTYTVNVEDTGDNVKEPDPGEILP